MSESDTGDEKGVGGGGVGGRLVVLYSFHAPRQPPAATDGRELTSSAHHGHGDRDEHGRRAE